MASLQLGETVHNSEGPYVVNNATMNKFKLPLDHTEALEDQIQNKISAIDTLTGE